VKEFFSIRQLGNIANAVEFMNFSNNLNRSAKKNVWCQYLKSLQNSSPNYHELSKILRLIS